MTDKAPQQPMPKQTGTQKKPAPPSEKGDQPVTTNPGFEKKPK